MNKNLIGSGFALASLALPSLAGAVTLLDTINLISQFINAAIPILIALAIVFFFYGLLEYVMKWSNSGISHMIGVVIAIFVMVSIWGIIKLLQNTFKVGDTNPVVPKAINISSTFQQ